MTTPASLTVGLADLQWQVAALYFGQETASPTVMTSGSPPTGLTATDVLQINRCIRDGLMATYSAYRWSFLRPRVTIPTYAPYPQPPVPPVTLTNTITVTSAGVVTLNNGTVPSDGGFPSYSATDGGSIYIAANTSTNFFGGSWTVGTYTSTTSVTLSNYTGNAVPAVSDRTYSADNRKLHAVLGRKHNRKHRADGQCRDDPNRPKWIACLRRVYCYWNIPKLLHQWRHRQTAYRRIGDGNADCDGRSFHAFLQPLPTADARRILDRRFRD